MFKIEHNVMIKCPACGQALYDGAVCVCGYDSTQDAVLHRSFAPLPTQSRRLRTPIISTTYAELCDKVSALEIKVRRLDSLLSELTQRVDNLTGEADIGIATADSTEAAEKKQAPQSPASGESDNQKLFVSAMLASTLSKGNIVPFGRYEFEDGKVSPMFWRVLSVHGSRALLLSERCLAPRTYHNTYAPVTWRECQLRAWLNSNFLNTAFSDAEKERLIWSQISVADDFTADRVFILSAKEAEKYLKTNEDRKAQNLSEWWLRSETPAKDCQRVLSNGAVSEELIPITSLYKSVRPAIQVHFGTAPMTVKKSLRNPAGGMISVTAEREFDKEGFLQKETVTDENGRIVNTVHYEYYPNGVRKRKCVIMPDGTVEFDLKYAKNGNAI